MLNRLWAKLGERPGDDKFDVLGIMLALLTGLLLFWGLHLLFFEIVYLHKYRYYHLHTWQTILARPDMLLVLSPALIFLLLTLRGRCRSNQEYARYTLAAALTVIFSAAIIALGHVLFWSFYETLP